MASLEGPFGRDWRQAMRKAPAFLPGPLRSTDYGALPSEWFAVLPAPPQLTSRQASITIAEVAALLFEGPGPRSKAGQEPGAGVAVALVARSLSCFIPFLSPSLFYHFSSLGGVIAGDRRVLANPLRIALALLRSGKIERLVGGHPPRPPRMGCAPATPAFAFQRCRASLLEVEDLHCNRAKPDRLSCNDRSYSQGLCVGGRKPGLPSSRSRAVTTTSRELSAPSPTKPSSSRRSMIRAALG